MRYGFIIQWQTDRRTDRKWCIRAHRANMHRWAQKTDSFRGLRSLGPHIRLHSSNFYTFDTSAGSAWPDLPPPQYCRSSYAYGKDCSFIDLIYRLTYKCHSGLIICVMAWYPWKLWEQVCIVRRNVSFAIQDYNNGWSDSHEIHIKSTPCALTLPHDLQCKHF